MGAMHTEMNMGDKILDVKTSPLWATGLAEALTEAKATGKYLLIAAGSEPDRSWKLGVALAFLDEDSISLSRKFHCVIVNENRTKGETPAGRPVVMICTSEGREVVSATADTVEELIPAIRAMMEHVVAVEEEYKVCSTCAKPTSTRPMSIRHFFGALAHAIMS